jgi:CRISPR type IV-associated protein Csf1
MLMAQILTAPLLFAGLAAEGSHHCFFCGGTCGEDVAAKDFVKSSFTGLDTVTLSPWVCRGCVASQGENDQVILPDGEIREGQKIRGYSWVITAAARTACTKAHRDWIMQQCLIPPDAPFVICLTDSGQKHLLYRAVVCYSRDMITVTLEGERIDYTPDALIERLALCKQIAAATGKPALKEALTPQSQMRIVEYHCDDRPLAAWLEVQTEPLSRLAAWLCPAKEECLNEYPDRTAAPAAKPAYKRVAAKASLFD